MSKSTTIINNLSMDRVVQVTISERKYLLFTFMHRVIIIIDMTNKKKPILLMNRTFMTKHDLERMVNHVIDLASSVNNNEEFLYKMDTYIDLYSDIQNDTTREIIGTYIILLEDYNL